MPYIYKTPRVSGSAPSMPAGPHVETSEVFTGQVLGKKASKPEELFARRLLHYKIDFWFRFIIPVHGFQIQGMRGEVEVDFVCSNGVMKPIQLDGEYAHKGAAMWKEDIDKDEIVNKYFREMGAAPVKRIPFFKLNDSDAIDRAVREYIL